MTPLSLESVVVAASGQVSCDLAGEAAILNLTSGMYYGLNAVGARVWTMLDHPTVVKHVLDRLLDEYEVEADRCEQDLLALLQQLANEGLVEIEHASE